MSTRLAVSRVAILSALGTGLAHCRAMASDGSTEITIRRLEQDAPNLASVLAQTGVGDQAWWLIVGGCVITCLAVAALALARRRHG